MENITTNNENSNRAGIQVNFDDFNISEESFKPVTKGLGFHQDQKRQQAFVSQPKEIKTISNIKAPILLNEISSKNQTVAKNTVPSGLEAFYGTKNSAIEQNLEEPQQLNIQKKPSEELSKNELASAFSQLTAWIIDLLLITSFVAITTSLLVVASGLSFRSFIKIVNIQDIALFGGVLFSLYYLLYFTVLDLTATPGKTILGIRLLKTNNQPVSVKHTFTRAFVSLLSGIALCLPNIIDFQGRLSDTKVVK